MQAPEKVKRSLPQGDKRMLGFLWSCSPADTPDHKCAKFAPEYLPQNLRRRSQLGIQFLCGGLGSRKNLAALDKLPWFEGKFAMKPQYLHQSAKERRCFIESGISRAKVSDCPCRLGCRLQVLEQSKLWDKERDRLRTAKRRTFKIARLPVPKDEQQRQAASTAISFADRGWT